MSVDKLKLALEVIGPVMMVATARPAMLAAITFLPPGEHFIDGQLAR